MAKVYCIIEREKKMCYIKHGYSTIDMLTNKNIENATLTPPPSTLILSNHPFKLPRDGLATDLAQLDRNELVLGLLALLLVVRPVAPLALRPAVVHQEASSKQLK